MAKGAVCDICNSRFSAFEGKALSNTIFGMERARNGVITKKGSNVKSKIGELEITGSEKFEKQVVTIKGLSVENFTEFDPATMTGKLVVRSFDKSETATSKLLLKIGLESIYTSRKELYEKYNFDDLRSYLLTSSNTDWPFLTTRFEPAKFTSVPQFLDRYYLKKIHCKLSFLEYDDNTLLFKFQYGAVAMVINLVNRKDKWIQEFSCSDKKARLYPEHFRKKFKIVYDDEKRI